MMQPTYLRFRGMVSAVLICGFILTSCTYEEVARYSIAQVFPVEEQDHAVRVAKCESGFNPEAVGFGNNYGVFQINSVNRRAVEDAGLDWEEVKVSTWANTLAAYVVWMRQGWRAWSCR